MRSRAPVAGSGSTGPGPDGGGAAGGSKPPPPNPAMPYRDDCWSEGATSVLIDAWGNRYLEVTRGNLRQKDWQDVADAVNSRKTVVKRPHRTDVQCKNRIDTIKKKFKSEKARIEGDGSGMGESQWPFYSRLESLIGSTATSLPSHPASTSARKKKKVKNSPNSPLHLLPEPSPPAPPPPPPTRKRSVATLLADSSLKWGNYSAAAAAAAAARDDEPEPDSESSKSSGYAVHPKRRVKKNVETRAPVKTMGYGHRDDDHEEVEGVKELASAITRFGEIYERVEIAKQKQMVELEKQRMEFSKDLEFQKMQMFIDSQVQINRIKRESENGGEHSEISGLEMLNLQLIKMIS